MPRRVSADAAHLPLPDLRRPPSGRARHRGSARPQRRRVDEALRRPLHAHAVALRLGRLGQARVGRAARCPTTASCRPARAARTSSGPSASAARSGCATCGSSCAATRTPGQLQGPGHDRAGQRRAAGHRRGRALGARAVLREHRRHVGVARGVRRRGGACRSRCSCRAAWCPPRSSCSRSRTARAVLALETDFDGCMAIVKELARRGLVYLANSMNPLRIEGQKTVAIEIVAAVRLGGRPTG